MTEIITRFCDPAEFADLSLSQYGRYASEGEAPPPFLVEHTVLLYVTDGVSSVKLNSIPFSIAPGMFVVLFPGVCAAFSVAEGQPCSAMWAELTGSSVPMLLRQAGLTPQRPLLSFDSASESVAAFTRLTDPEQDYTPLRAAGIAMELLDSMLQETPHPLQVRISNLQEHYVSKSIRYIESKYPQDISVEDVAEYCGLNRSYLGKLFRDSTGMTTQEYLIRHRMKIACEYLARGAASIATIARSVGYPNQLHFSRAFHKVFGIPPREWQKRNRRD